MRRVKCDEHKIRKLYQSGMEYTEIANETGLTSQIVERVILSGLKTKQVDFDKWSDFIIDKHLEGFNDEDIAEFIGCDDTLIYCYLRVNRAKVFCRKIDLEVARLRREKPPIREVGAEVIDSKTGKKYYDYTDVMIERVCEATIPEWKYQFEREGKVNFGLGEYRK